MADRVTRGELTPDDGLDDRQLAALDSLRRGHPAGARKRITQARKRHLT